VSNFSATRLANAIFKKFLRKELRCVYHRFLIVLLFISAKIRKINENSKGIDFAELRFPLSRE